jgi:hypothetical protein
MFLIHKISLFPLNNLPTKPLVEARYFGTSIKVPPGTCFLATDSDGKVFAYKDTPFLSRGSWITKHLSEHIATVSLIGNWRDSLQEI